MIGPRGYVVYRGPSALNGRPIVGLITLYSENRKIGDMAQLWILDDGRMAPHRAVQTGRDASICGACPLKGGRPGTRACYVRMDLIDQTWSRYHAGKYPVLPPAEWRRVLGVRPLRLGAYGDPAALPLDVVRRLTTAAGGRWTGYTHQWRTVPRAWRRYLMASVESDAGRAEAHAAGYRTFRIRAAEAPIAAGEIVCPATAEGGTRTACGFCRLCDGQRGGRRPDVVAVAHGSGRYLVPLEGGSHG